MKAIVETKTLLGSGAETRIIPCKGDVTTELRNCLNQAAKYEEVVLTKDTTDDGIESYNNGNATVENDKASFAYNYTIYNWVVCDIPDVNITLIVEGGMIRTAYSTVPGVTYDVLDLDTNDGDRRAVNCSIIDSLKKKCYEIGGTK